MDIKLERKNVFCFDNEAFRYLMIVKDPKKPAHFRLTPDEERQFKNSWSHSRDVSYDLIKYVDTLEPMQMSELVAFDVAKRTNQEWALKTRDKIVQLLQIKVEKNICDTTISPAHAANSSNKPNSKRQVMIFLLFENFIGKIFNFKLF